MQHLPRKFNKEADLLSRQDVQAFKQLVPSADQNPTAVKWDLWRQYISRRCPESLKIYTTSGCLKVRMPPTLHLLTVSLTLRTKRGCVRSLPRKRHSSCLSRTYRLTTRTASAAFEQLSLLSNPSKWITTVRNFGDVSIGYIAFSRVSNGVTGNPTIEDSPSRWT